MRLRTSIPILVLLLSVASCKAGYCKGYRDACLKDCAKTADAKTCPATCDEKLKTHPGYKGCEDTK